MPIQPVARSDNNPPEKIWRDVGRWLILLPLVPILIFLCSLTSHVGLGYPLPGEIRSNIRATYARWDRLDVAPVSTGIIQDLPEWQDTSPDDISHPGDIWFLPTVTPIVLTIPAPTATQSEISLLPPTPSQVDPTSTSSPLLSTSPYPTSTATGWMLTATPTRTSTLFFYFTVTPTFTRTSTHPSQLQTATSTFTRTPTTQFIPTTTITPTSIQTPTLPAIITATATPTLTGTIFTSTPTLTPTITFTPTITLTPTITPTYTPTQPPCGGNIPAGEPDIGPPDGSFASLPCGGVLILDLPALGHNPIDLTSPDAVYDLVFYERRLPPPDSTVIELDWVSVSVGSGPSGSCDTSEWYYGFNWGDGIVTNNGHLGNLFPEFDNQQIPTLDLYGTPPLQTGVAIDLDDPGLGIPAGLYPCLRVISPFNYPDNDPSEVDALEILQ